MHPIAHRQPTQACLQKDGFGLLGIGLISPLLVFTPFENKKIAWLPFAPNNSQTADASLLLVFYALQL